MHISCYFSCFPVYFFLKKFLRFLNDFFLPPPAQVHPLPAGEDGRRVGRPRVLRCGGPVPVLPHPHRAAVPPGNIQVHKVQRHTKHLLLPKGRVLRVRARRAWVMLFELLLFLFCDFLGNYGKQLPSLKTLFFTHWGFCVDLFGKDLFLFSSLHLREFVVFYCPFSSIFHRPPPPQASPFNLFLQPPPPPFANFSLPLSQPAMVAS